MNPAALSCPAHGESIPSPSKSPTQKPSLTLTGNEALVASQVAMLTNGKLPDSFVDVIKC